MTDPTPLAVLRSKRFAYYSATVLEYTEGVLSGGVPANELVQKAVRRHLDDLHRSEAVSYPYHYEPLRGAVVCWFIENLPHTKGEWAERKERLILSPWQIFLVMVLFGWLRRKGNKRRFREAYWEIPRKNGKSPLAAAIGLYMLCADGEFGAEVYSGASTEKQAWEVFKPAKLMVDRTPALQRAAGVRACAKMIVHDKDGGKFEPIIGNPGDGSSPSCAIVDEFHEHDTPALYDTMQTGMGARSQPLMLVITTAGYNNVGPCHEKHDEVCKVLDNVIENEELFGVIFGIDPQDDWADPKSLIKANPNYGVSVDADFLKSMQRSAMANPVQQNRFKTKHMNVWTSVLLGWMNMQLWEMARDDDLDEDEVHEMAKECWISADLASKTDLCTEQRLYRHFVMDKPHYYLFGRYWLPEEEVNEPGPNHKQYLKWVRTGKLLQTEGATIDFAEITEQVVADCKARSPKEFVYDPFNATQMAQTLMAAGVRNVVEFQQTPWNFALPMDELQSALKDGRFHHDGHPITSWCWSNVVARPAKKGLFSPIKMKPAQKIDGAIATLMVLARATASKERAKFQMISL